MNNFIFLINGHERVFYRWNSEGRLINNEVFYTNCQGSCITVTVDAFDFVGSVTFGGIFATSNIGDGHM